MAAVRPMLATLDAPPSPGPASSTSRSTTASGRSSTSTPARKARSRRRALVAQRQRERRRSSRDRRARSRHAAQAAARPLLIDGEIVALDAHGQPPGSSTPGTHPSHGSAATSPRRRAQPAALIAFDLLRDGDEDLRGCRSPAPAACDCRNGCIRAASAPTRSASATGRRRRPRDAAARAARRLGRADRQGRRSRRTSGRRTPGVAQAQAPDTAGVRGRRLDRAAADAPALRRAAARRLRRRRRAASTSATPAPASIRRNWTASRRC